MHLTARRRGLGDTAALASRDRRRGTRRLVSYEEPDGTVLEAHGQGTRAPIPFIYILTERANDNGIAKHIVEIISRSQDFNDLAT